ncbi:uncharacterized protein LOC106868157 [Octopus bimaculoides]|uniref:Uncharacterized protein n=1 Tax=Octopus bimaculoides TaxID=37653 RepID=A0A0L8HWN1_OCTBM|nr:uncharacterized protein LOC106868157 [Octopus bimaculoides]XP_014768782.1 uncharacterized protein LOC106868157 [Octopus bimaculoides]XP_014768783.1 uncharacterized protein LOC106868157 [Octopus bimaculoides]XP_014768784.1 uncharacterized protein LOC106868157 [Octopus bimaculoides]XP_052823285.1 uncharacterized protein LOC106868157 [Octopus bimaculoides]XP_052823286.1 uncharacterized protein LOC106868157 [Octopus bimaculoides]|eukprot:XP_014768781.1 PREDICTED: uncharacterized protein LOC106868157 [Octopus bimaculoides]
MNETTTFQPSTQSLITSHPVTQSSNNDVIIGVSISVVLLILVISLVLLCKYKPQLFPCFSHNYQRARQSSQLGLSFEQDKDYQHETDVPDIVSNDEGYFYDEIFGKSAFTDETTNHSITNLFSITDYDDNPERFTSERF